MTTSPLNLISRLGVPAPEVERQTKMAALVARQRRQARAERLERKRSEHLRGRLPLDDPDRHDLDTVDACCARLAPGYPQGGEA